MKKTSWPASYTRSIIPPEIVQELFGLTKTEATVTSLLAQGISAEEIAERLCVSVHTVRTHVRSIFKKTGASKQTELIRRVLKIVPNLRHVPTKEKTKEKTLGTAGQSLLHGRG